MSASNTQKASGEHPPSDATMADAPDSPIQQSSQRNNSVSINGDKVASGAPGSSWNNKKFNEEYDRAWNTVLDKDFDHTKFGDVLMK